MIVRKSSIFLVNKSCNTVTECKPFCRVSHKECCLKKSLFTSLSLLNYLLRANCAVQVLRINTYMVAP